VEVSRAERHVGERLGAERREVRVEHGDVVAARGG